MPGGNGDATGRILQETGFPAAQLAEGVETAAQAAYLRERGCDFAQRYHFSRPMSAADLSTMLSQQTTAVTLAV